VLVVVAPLQMEPYPEVVVVLEQKTQTAVMVRQGR
jgi:hypothetical protein